MYTCNGQHVAHAHYWKMLFWCFSSAAMWKYILDSKTWRFHVPHILKLLDKLHMNTILYRICWHIRGISCQVNLLMWLTYLERSPGPPFPLHSSEFWQGCPYKPATRQKWRKKSPQHTRYPYVDAMVHDIVEARATSLSACTRIRLIEKQLTGHRWPGAARFIIIN